MTPLDQYRALVEPRVPALGGRDYAPALADCIKRRDAIIRLLAEQLCVYGGHLDGCEGMAGYMDPRCTCGLGPLLSEVQKEFGE